MSAQDDEQDLPAVPARRRGRPPAGTKAMTSAERQQWRRIRQAEVVATTDTDAWTEAHCLSILNGLRWRGGAMDKAAWQRLGKLRGFT